MSWRWRFQFSCLARLSLQMENWMSVAGRDSPNRYTNLLAHTSRLTSSSSSISSPNATQPRFRFQLKRAGRKRKSLIAPDHDNKQSKQSWLTCFVVVFAKHLLAASTILLCKKCSLNNRLGGDERNFLETFVFRLPCDANHANHRQHFSLRNDATSGSTETILMRKRRSLFGWTSFNRQHVFQSCGIISSASQMSRISRRRSGSCATPLIRSPRRRQSSMKARSRAKVKTRRLLWCLGRAQSQMTIKSLASCPSQLKKSFNLIKITA